MCDVAHSSTCIRVCDAPHSSPGRQCNSCAFAASRRYGCLRFPVVSAVQHFYVGNQTGLSVATARDRGFVLRNVAGDVPPNRERGAGSGTLRCRVSSGTGGTLGSWSSCLLLIASLVLEARIRAERRAQHSSRESTASQPSH